MRRQEAISSGVEYKTVVSEKQTALRGNQTARRSTQVGYAGFLSSHFCFY